MFLTLVFGVAGIAKLNDRAGTRRALTSFGVTERLVMPLGWALPIIELITALALLPTLTAWWGATLALALLLVFTVAIARSLMRGQSPDCRCFGQLHAAPVTRTTLLRNLALAAVAVFIVAFGKNDPGPGAFDWTSSLRTTEVAGLIVALILIATVIALAILSRRLLKRQAALVREVASLRAALAEDSEPLAVLRQDVLPPQEGLPIGVAAPPFTLATLADERVSLSDLLSAGRPALLIFAGPDCWGCKVLLPVVRRWQREYADRLTVAVISGATREETEAKMAAYEIDHLLLDEDSQVADDYQARWTPAAVMVSKDGRIHSHVSYGDNAIREWLRNQVASGALPSHQVSGMTSHLPQVTTRYAVCQIGEPAPRFSLFDLAGNHVRTEDLRGNATLLVFWHPRCAYCAAMRDDLRSWEEQAAAERPRLVFVAAGELDDIRAINRQFKSLTLMDPAFDIAPLFGTKYTPSAILIDDEGRVASSLAIGEANVRALIGLPKLEMSTVAAS
jgi:peroxiredoxin/multisubunit Na+/H+ antiporter MnhC subunit